jgi:hypothetical protein
VREKLFWGLSNAQLKVWILVSGFRVMVVFAPNESPIKNAKSCCGFSLWAGATAAGGMGAGMGEKEGAITGGIAATGGL